jgi:DNA-binding NarL/FixJ family response regulator
MDLAESVEAALDPESGAGLCEALRCMRDDFAVDRVSLHVFDKKTGIGRVMGSAGRPLLADGTEFPVDISTPLHVAAHGEVFVGSSWLHDPAFSRCGDKLVTDMGFESGCAVPLLIGNRPSGALALTSCTPDRSWDLVVDEVQGISASVTLAVHAAERTGSLHILVCHPDRLVGEGIARVLEQAFPISLRLAPTPVEALSYAAGAVVPLDVVICDSQFGEGRAHSFLRELRRVGVEAPTLVFDTHDSPLGYHIAMRSGAAGYVGDSEGPLALAGAVRKLSLGQTVGLTARHPVNGSGGEPAQRFTLQESRLLLLLERGLRFKQIALEMNISESTAKGYARNLFAKLDVHSRAEAVYEARRQGVLDMLRLGLEASAESAEQEDDRLVDWHLAVGAQRL